MELPQAVQQLQIPLLLLTNIIALALPSGLFRIAATLPISLLLVYQSRYIGANLWYGDSFPFSCIAVYCLFAYFDWIVLNNAERESWHKVKNVKNHGDGEGESGVVPQSFWARVWWGMRLVTTNRFTGWSQQVKNVPVEFPRDYPRWLFVGRKALRVILMHLIADATHSYTAATPHGSYREDGKIPVGLEGVPLSRQIFFSWVFVVLTYANLERANAVYGIIAVATGLAPPNECPSAFGDLKEAYTVRNAWAVTWHQNCRRVCSAPSIWLARDVLKLRKGSFASKYVQLFAAFFISATVHGVAVMLSLGSLEDDCCYAVFMAQAVAILVEDHAIDAGKRLGLKASLFWRLVGYVWVFLWFGVSLSYWVSAFTHHGLWIHERMQDVFGLGPTI